MIEVEASWEMNEPAEATTMVDSGPYGLDATVDQSGIDTGSPTTAPPATSGAGADPIAPPASPERVIVIPDNSRPRPARRHLHRRDPVPDQGTSSATSPRRARPPDRGPVEDPEPRAAGPRACTRVDPARCRPRVNPLNDNAWHVLGCVKTPTSVELWVDGVRVGRKNGAVGYIDNDFPMTIGGKISCDQDKVDLRLLLRRDRLRPPLPRQLRHGAHRWGTCWATPSWPSWSRGSSSG